MKTKHVFRLTCTILLAGMVTDLAGQVKIGDNPGTLAPCAVLELEKTNQGLLITRVALTGATDNSTIPTPVDALLIFNTANAGSGGNVVSPGFYYWDNTASRWKGLMTAAGPAGDVWIDGNNNILSNNSGNQVLTGTRNVVLGEEAFEDWDLATNNYIAIGYQAGKEDTTDGDANVIAVGALAAFSNAGANLNALGYQASYSNSGYDVNSMGWQAGYLNSGTGVNALGKEAAFGNVADYVNALGENAARNNLGRDVNAFGERAAENNFVGHPEPGGSVNALGNHAACNNQGSLVNAFGPNACLDNSGWSVNALGSAAAEQNQGSEVNAMGAMAAMYNTTANVNALGRLAAMYNTGYGVNALGDQAAKFNNGDHAVAIGDSALFGDTLVLEGGGNIGIGFSAGSNVGTGYRNICIGFGADIPDPNANDQLNIGNSIIKTNDGVVHVKDMIQLNPRTDAPVSPEKGTMYYDDDEDIIYAWDGTAWQALW